MKVCRKLGVDLEAPPPSSWPETFLEVDRALRVASPEDTPF